MKASTSSTIVWGLGVHMEKHLDIEMATDLLGFYRD